MTFNPSRISAICFDVDGTLRDTDDEYVARFARYLSPFRFALPRRDPRAFARKLVMWVETPANWLYGLPDWLGIDDELASLADWLYRNGVSTNSHNFLLINGIRDMLDKLKPNYRMAVVSARSARGTLAFIEHFGLAPYFDCIAHAQTTPRTKPQPDPLLWAAEQMQVQPAECLMVGDTTVDIRAGRAAGMQTVGVLCGLGQEAELKNQGADLLLPSTTDLPGALQA